MRKYGTYLRQIREINKESQKQLAESIGINQSQISYYENDKNIPNIDYIERIADYYNISIDELIGRDYVGYTTRKDKP